jgi:hypothetical protein
MPSSEYGQQACYVLWVKDCGPQQAYKNENDSGATQSKDARVPSCKSHLIGDGNRSTNAHKD